MSATGQARASYPASLRAEAIQLAEAGGWSYWEITRIFARRGVDPVPTPNTIRWWLKGSVDVESQMEHQRRSKARRQALASGGRLLGKARSPEFKLARIRALRDEAGLSYSGIAKVMAFDFGDRWLTDDIVRHAIETGRYPQERTA